MDRGKRIPSGYVGEATDTVAAVKFLFSDKTRYMNGTNIHVSGAWEI
jgi:NAD(P)-dependent dehydrogenase (short-subunit alcohol dehydrogenase family)